MRKLTCHSLLLLGAAACSRLAAPNALPPGPNAAAHATKSSSSGYKTVLSFDGTDGSDPVASLTELKGVLYGTTRLGGTDDQGTVFGLSASGAARVVHDFAGYPHDGGWPEAGLTAVKGVLYGTTFSGGNDGNGGKSSFVCVIGERSKDEDGCGSLFKVSTSGKESVLYNFGVSNENILFPSNGNLAVVNGALYGTTSIGSNEVRGTVYSSSTTGDVSLLYGFKGYPSDGQYPRGSLLVVNGLIYGTTPTGGNGSCHIPQGSRGCGTVFAVGTSGTESVVYSFQGQSDGAYPKAGLISVGGTLYGTTQNGGTEGKVKHCASGCGTVFAITPSGTESVVYRFQGESDGASPEAGLIAVGSTLYGTTYYGGGKSDSGTVFALTTNGTETVLHRFGEGSDGKNPSASLTDFNGTLYGTTASGGASGDGTVFSLTP
jgi:uncharacterized repeat protein (TIGR03803 family)